ncbi:hypothetical protein Cni_G06269 [Canna indica]|uniref:Uncharacterized protein n=1 Tax=Canna indica TaxID=4628 RepID=A0AAQ3JWN1_9LILI|nr:hypothetical protein Cni_G06269 [Canna indica]
MVNREESHGSGSLLSVDSALPTPMINPSASDPNGSSSYQPLILASHVFSGIISHLSLRFDGSPTKAGVHGSLPPPHVRTADVECIDGLAPLPLIRLKHFLTLGALDGTGCRLDRCSGLSWSSLALDRRLWATGSLRSPPSSYVVADVFSSTWLGHLITSILMAWPYMQPLSSALLSLFDLIVARVVQIGPFFMSQALFLILHFFSWLSINRFRMRILPPLPYPLQLDIPILNVEDHPFPLDVCDARPLLTYHRRPRNTSRIMVRRSLRILGMRCGPRDSLRRAAARKAHSNGDPLTAEIIMRGSTSRVRPPPSARPCRALGQLLLPVPPSLSSRPLTQQVRDLGFLFDAAPALLEAELSEFLMA